MDAQESKAMLADYMTFEEFLDEILICRATYFRHPNKFPPSFVLGKRRWLSRAVVVDWLATQANPRRRRRSVQATA